MDVNVTKEKKQTNMRASAPTEPSASSARRPRPEQAIEFINDDELVEVTPATIGSNPFSMRPKSK